MYDRFLSDLKQNYPRFPTEPSLDLGLAIKQIRLRMGVTQDELGSNAKMKPTALKTLENGYAKFTKTSNLEALARALHTSPREIVLEAREWFPANFFVLKLSELELEKKRRKKVREEIWFKRKLLIYDGFTVDFLSPPIVSPAHFSFMIIEVAPGRKIEGLKLRYPNEVSGFIQKGTAKIVYDGAEEDLFGNQGFALRGDKPHDLINMDRDNPLRLFLACSLSPSRALKETPKAKQTSPSFSVGRAIAQIRELYSDSSTRPLTFAELSYLTGLDEKGLQYLETTTQPDQVVYWDKIEKITQALRMPLSRFIDLAEGRDKGYLHVATAHDRALIDYRHYLGVRLKSALLPRAGASYHISEIYIEPKEGIRRAAWKRTDEAMISVYVEDGELLIEVGKNRKTKLVQGESVYFDGRLGYLFTNPGAKPAKLIAAAFPAIVF